MKLYSLCILGFLVLISCTKQTKINKQFNCKSTYHSSALEEITDVKKEYTVTFPKNWKTNLYYDAIQSSIYGADTTKQLSKTTILDVSLIHQKINFDAQFQLLLEKENLAKNLITINTKIIDFKNKKAFFSVSIGKKNNLKLKLLDLFIKVDENRFLHSKTTIYGDSLIDQRICNTIDLIEKINIQQ